MLADEKVREFLSVARVAHLATSSKDGDPHCVPLCFSFENTHFYFIVDEKPKRRSGRALKRIRNILENPKVSLIVDHYEEQWGNLAYVLVRGTARIVDEDKEYMVALRSLRDKYPQYRTMKLSADKNLMVRIDPVRIHVWGARFSGSDQT